MGMLLGEKIIPYVIITAYGIMYHNVSNTISIDYQLSFALIASGASIVCTVGATLFACTKELQETPASLMRPPAPKEGKRGASGANYIYMEASKLFLEIYYSKSFPL